MIRGRNVKTGYLPQTPRFEENDTVLSAVLSGESGENPEGFTKESEARAMLTRLGLDAFDKPVAELSADRENGGSGAGAAGSGGFSGAGRAHQPSGQQMSDWLEDYLNRFRGTLLMVTHDRYFLDRVADRILEVDQGKVYSYPGSYHIYVERKEERLDMARASERKRQSILKTELQWLARGARARSTKQKAHIQRIGTCRPWRLPRNRAVWNCPPLLPGWGARLWN